MIISGDICKITTGRLIIVIYYFTANDKYNKFMINVHQIYFFLSKLWFSITADWVKRDVCQFIKLLQGDLHWKNVIVLAIVGNWGQ